MRGARERERENGAYGSIPIVCGYVARVIDANCWVCLISVTLHLESCINVYCCYDQINKNNFQELHLFIIYKLNGTFTF